MATGSGIIKTLIHNSILYHLLCLVHCCNVFSFETSQFHSKFEEVYCGDSFGVTELPIISTALLRSNIHCARTCSEVKLCQYFRSSPQNEGTFLCDLIKRDTPSAQRNGSGLSKTNAAWGNSRSLDRASCFKRISNCGEEASCGGSSLNSHCYEDQSSDLHDGQWLSVLDNTIPITQTVQSMNRWSHEKEIKLVVYEYSGTVVSVSLTWVIFYGLRFTGFMAYAMEKNENGFANWASRIIYFARSDGTVIKGFSPVNGSSWITSMSPERMEVFAKNSTAYTKIYEATQKNVDPLISDLQKGYSIQEMTHAAIGDSHTNITMFSINRRMGRSRNDIKVPLAFIQVTHDFPERKVRFTIKMGDSGNIPNVEYKGSGTVIVDTLWRPTVEANMNSSHQFTLISRLMTMGHQFRVAIDGREFSDVDVVIQLNDDIYFSLPQRTFTPNGSYFNQRTCGVKMTVSLAGRLAICIHQLEGELVFSFFDHPPFWASVQTFVDKKSRAAIFSVNSDGTVPFGNAESLANAVTAGKDISVLVEWLQENRKLVFSACEVTVKDIGRPTLVVTAESKVAWHLTEKVPGVMGVDEHCRMEKILASSDGSVQVLVYNMKLRQPVVTLQNIRTVWYAG